MSDGDLTCLVYISAENRALGALEARSAFRRSAGHWTSRGGREPAFSGSYPYMAALLRRQGVERSQRSGLRSERRSLGGSQQVLRYAPLLEVLVARHRPYVERSRAMAVHSPIVQLGLTSRLGSARCARNGVAWHALNGCDGWSRKSWRYNGRRSRYQAG